MNKKTAIDGDSLSFQEIASGNNVTLVNFWASWCGPCRLEMPAFERLYAEKKEQGFTILAVNLDTDREKMEEYLRERPLGFTVLVDSAAMVSEEYGVKVIPTSVLVDRNRTIIRIIEGMQPSIVESVVNRELRKKR